MKNVLAFDYGASSGRAILGSFDGEKLKQKEVHRFSNTPVYLGETLYWDFLRLYHNLKQGLVKGCATADIDSVGIDTWGVDFGLIDFKGKMLENPVHYRDNRTDSIVDDTFEIVSEQELYAQTGIQIKNFNTIFQLMYLAKYRPELLERADKMLLMPDLFAFFLTGNTSTEQTIATTTQLYSNALGNWDSQLIAKLGLPARLFTPVAAPGTRKGQILASLCTELSIPSLDVIAICSHDTASAVVSMPTTDQDSIYLSCGTWSLMGIETDEPIINKKTYEYNFTNEGGYGNIRFLKNIIGLWIIQECKREWESTLTGGTISYDTLVEEAMAEKQFEFIFDPNLDVFVKPGNMVERVRKMACNDKDRAIKPETRGQIVRTIYENLAFTYRRTVNEIEEVTGKVYSTIHVVGGGSQNKVLMQFTANATGKNVVAGPAEATAYGNMAVQLISSGELSSLDEARQVIKSSADIQYFSPKDYELWNEVYECRFS